MRYRRRRILNFGYWLILRSRQRPGCLAGYRRASRVSRVDDLKRAKEPRQIDHVVRG